MGREVPSDMAGLHETEHGDFSDMELAYHVRDALISAQLDNRDNYEELLGHLHSKDRYTADQVALLVTTLKALTGAVSYIHMLHHSALIQALFGLRLWNHGTDVIDALLELILSLAASNGEFVHMCLDMLVREFVPPSHSLEWLKQPRGITRKSEVLSRVHAALKDISDLVPLAPMLLSPIVVQKMPNRHNKHHKEEIVIYVENMLRLESGAIGEIVGVTMLVAVVDKMIELDVEIEWDGNLQDEAKDIFDMELEDTAEPVDDFEIDDMLNK